MWESHIGPYKEWAVKMTKPEAVIEDDGGAEAEEEGEPIDGAESAATESEGALEQACKATVILIKRSY